MLNPLVIYLAQRLCLQILDVQQRSKEKLEKKKQSLKYNRRHDRSNTPLYEALTSAFMLMCSSLTLFCWN